MHYSLSAEIRRNADSKLPTRFRPSSRSAFVIVVFVALLACGATERLRAEGARKDWAQTYNGPASRIDYAHSVAVDAAGDIFVTGMMTDPVTGTDIRTAKYSGSDGRLLWERSYSGNGAVDFGDFGFVLRLDPNGNPIVFGKAEGIYVAKYGSSDGHVLWEKVLPRTDQGGPEQPRALAVDAQGNIAVAGKGYGTLVYDSFTGRPYFVYDFYTAKLSGDGQVLWSQRHAGPGGLDDIPYAVTLDGDGNVVVAGESSGAKERVNWYVAKYASGDGHMLWEQRFSTSVSSNDRAYAVAVDPTGNVVATGKAETDLYTVKYAGGDGHHLWANRLTDVSYGEGDALVIDASGNAIVAGQSYAKSPPRASVVKYDATDGHVLWQRHHDGGEVALAAAVRLDPAGNVFVAGYQLPTGGNYDLFLHKFRGGDGSIAWKRNYSTAGYDDFVGSKDPLALTPGGGAVLAGYFKKSFNDYDWAVVKYTPAGDLLNIAARMPVQTGDNALFAGFIITGEAEKKVLLRGLGPSLPVSGKLADPTLQLNKSDGTSVSNDNWKTDQRAEIDATTIPPTDELESAIVATLAPGSHTAILRGNGDTTGGGLIEVYDLDQQAPAALANISSRGAVRTNDDVMIGGIIIGGGFPAKVLIRALGPSLPVSGALQDPTLQLVDANGNSTTNDNWTTTQRAEIEATTIPPEDTREAAIVSLLVPGSYTAIVRGKNNTTGVALVEAYNLQ